MCTVGDVGHRTQISFQNWRELSPFEAEADCLLSINVPGTWPHTCCAAHCPMEHAAQWVMITGKDFRSHRHDEHGNSHLQQRIRLLVRFPKICQNVFKFRALHFMSWIFHSLSSDILVSIDAGENISYQIRKDYICMHTHCLSLFGASITR